MNSPAWIPELSEKQRKMFSDSQPFRMHHGRWSVSRAIVEAMERAGILVRSNVRMCGKTSIICYQYADWYRRMLYEAFDPCI